MLKRWVLNFDFLHHATQLTSSFRGWPFHRGRQLAVAVSCWHRSSRVKGKGTVYCIAINGSIP